MARTINLNVDIPEDRHLRIVLPADVPAGPAEIVVTVASPARPENTTLAQLAQAEFFGMWKDRADIADSLRFAEELRTQGWKRSG